MGESAVFMREGEPSWDAVVWSFGCLLFIVVGRPDVGMAECVQSFPQKEGQMAGPIPGTQGT